MLGGAKYRNLYNIAGLVRRAGGFRRADELLAFLGDWRDFVVAHDREPESFREYVRWTRRFSPRICWSRLAALRAAYPEAGPSATPSDFLRSLLDQLERDLEEGR